MQFIDQPHSNLALGTFNGSICITSKRTVLCSKCMSMDLFYSKQNYQDGLRIIYDGRVITYDELLLIDNAVSVQTYCTSFIILLDTGKLIYICAWYDATEILKLSNDFTIYNIKSIYSKIGYLLFTVELEVSESEESEESEESPQIINKYKVFWVSETYQFDSSKSVDVSEWFAFPSEIIDSTYALYSLLYISNGYLNAVDMRTGYPLNSLVGANSGVITENIIDKTFLLDANGSKVLGASILDASIHSNSIFILLVSGEIIYYFSSPEPIQLYSTLQTISNIKKIEFILSACLLTLNDGTIIINILDRVGSVIQYSEHRNIVNYFRMDDILCLIDSDNMLYFEPLTINKCLIPESLLSTGSSRYFKDAIDSVQANPAFIAQLNIDKIIKFAKLNDDTYILYRTKINTIEGFYCMNYKKVDLAISYDLGEDKISHQITEIYLSCDGDGSYI